MLLRTSSAPVLNSLFCPHDAEDPSQTLQHQHPHHHHTLIHPSASTPSSSSSSAAHRRRPSSDFHVVTASSASASASSSSSSSSDVPPPPHPPPPRSTFTTASSSTSSSSSAAAASSRMIRAQSESDLACFSSAMSVLAEEADPSSFQNFLGSKQWNSRRKLSSLMHRTPSVDLFSAEDSLITKEDEEEAEKEEDVEGEGDGKQHNSIVLSDGEVYSNFYVSAGGSTVACNAKGCRPLTDDECKKLGFLSLARGVRVSSYGGGLDLITPEEEEEAEEEEEEEEEEKQKEQNLNLSANTEAYYQSMLKKDPTNPLLLRNCAQFLSEKGDVKRSEEYYERAILADPHDGEVLSQYAKLQWDVHKDQDRAEMYYDQAVQAAPDDCYVMASYASFLWDVDDDEGSLSAPTTMNVGPSTLPSTLFASA